MKRKIPESKAVAPAVVVPVVSHTPLVCADLDALADGGSKCPRCSEHHANVYYPQTTCHPTLNLVTFAYERGSGVIALKCVICGGEVLQIKVAQS